MNNDFPPLMQLVTRSFTEPRSVAEYLLSLRISRNNLWLMLGLVSVLSALVLSGVSAVSPTPENMQPIILSPWMAAVLVGVVMISLTFALYYVGQWMGGTGSLDDTMLIVAWHQGITVAFQVLQLVVVLFSPGLGALLNLAGIIFLFYVLLQFIDVLHGFESLAKSFGSFAFALVGMMLGMAVILSFLGVPSVSPVL